MTVISIFDSSELEATQRIDSEYYDPKYLNLENKILKTKSYDYWGNLDGDFITGPFGSEFKVENYVQNESFRYIRGKDVKEFFVLDNDNVYVPKKDFERLRKYSLKTGDVLISVVGTLGNCAIVDSKMPSSIFSCKSTVFRPKKINPFYLIAYLNSEYGKILLERRVRGTVQTGLNMSDLKSLPIFLPDEKTQTDVADLIIKARNHLECSKSLFIEAKDKLLEMLNLTNYNFKHKISYTAKISRILDAQRIDSEYFQPIYEDLEKHLITNFNSEPLGDIDFIDITTGQYSEQYVDQKIGNPYLRGTDIENGTINTDELVSIDPREQVESKKALEGDVVVSRVGTIGLSARIPKECDGGTISDNLIRLRFNEKKLNSYYLVLFLSSIIGVNFMKRNSRGSVQQRLNQETLKDILIPIVSYTDQTKLGNIVKKSHTQKQESKNSLNLAMNIIHSKIQ